MHECAAVRVQSLAHQRIHAGVKVIAKPALIRLLSFPTFPYDIAVSDYGSYLGAEV